MSERWEFFPIFVPARRRSLAGALVGLWRWRFAGRYRSGSRSPYRETQMRWHHLTGLAFGAVLLAWIFSGLMSMNPVGIFDAKTPPDVAAYRGDLPGKVRPALALDDVLAHLEAEGFAVREMEWRMLSGRPNLLARDAHGATRIVQQGTGGELLSTSQFTPEALETAAARLLAAPIVDAALLSQHDRYYFQRQEASMYGAREHRLPVLRLTYGDASGTLAYLDPRTGDVLLTLDRSQRVGRWLFNLLHSWDLSVLLRAGLLRDAALVLLSVGSMIIAVTGIVIGWRRAKASLSRRRLTPRPARTW